MYGAGTRSRTRDLLITSQLLYQLSYTGVMAGEYIESGELVKPSCLIRLKKIGRLMSVGFGWVAGALGRGGEGRNSCKGRQEFSSCGDGIGGDYASN